MQLFCLLFIGVTYAYVYQKKFQSVQGLRFFSVACVFAASLLLVLSGVYFFKEQFQFLLVFPLSCAFLLPAAIMASWNVFDFSDDVQNQKIVWYYHADESIDPSFVYIENLQVTLHVFVDERKAGAVKGTLPAAVELGTAISHLILKKDPLQKGLSSFYDPGMKPYGWIFYTKKLRKKHYLDPEETALGNGLFTKATIYVERISN